MLYDHQKRILNDDPKYSGIFTGTGSGKTRIALELARGSTLVIAPKQQTLDKTWENNAEKFGIIINLRVISKETFRRDWQTLPRFDTVIVEEAHTCLGATPYTKSVKRVSVPKNSQLFDALDSFLRATKPERLYLCTATIIKNPMTVWAAWKLLGKEWDWYKWRDTFYFRIKMGFREIWSVRRDEATKARLAEAVKSIGYVGRLEEFFDVPDQTFIVKNIELTEKQKQRIKELPLEYPEPITLIGKKHQVENGILLGNEFSQTEIFDNGKIDEIIELSYANTRMIVFARYTEQINQIEGALKKEGKKTFTLTGATKDREGVMNEAKACDDYVFIAQCQVSSGWELPECPVVVFASCDYSFVNRVQAEGRVQRANNIKKNLYIDLIAGSIDKAVYECLKSKKSFDERLYLEDNKII
jgi:superfamily II DNA or RNA helicase